MNSRLMYIWERSIHTITEINHPLAYEMKKEKFNSVEHWPYLF